MNFHDLLSYAQVPPQQDSARTAALGVAAALRGGGFETWLVGGCVRDLVLGHEPADYDVATNATPDEILAVFPRAQLVGAQFGVVLVDGIEVATYRSEGAYVDGRHPGEVRFERDVRQDVLRRDFTINALLLDPERIDSARADVVDLVGGLDDLRAGLIRAIGDPLRRFEEDHLRMLRAVRFAARFDFEIEPSTFGAIRALRSSIRRVAAERVRDEFSRILTEGHARRGFELLDATGVLEEILPEVAAMKGVAQPPEYHPEGDVWTHTLMMLDRLESPSITLALGVLLHDVGKPPTFRVAPDRIRFDSHAEVGERMTHDILTRLRFPNEVIAQVCALVASHMKFKDVPNMRESTLKRFLRLPGFDEHLELHRLDCSSSHGNLSNYEFAKTKLDEAPPEQLRPPRLIGGGDLIEAGYRPGPQFSKMLEAVEDAQLEGRIHSREEAMELVAELFGGA